MSAPVRQDVAVGKSSNTVRECCNPGLVCDMAEPHADDLAKGFAALADPVRLRLLSLISATGECCSCDLEQPLQRSQPTISHHTRVLAEAGLITGEKQGKWTIWRVSSPKVESLLAGLAALQQSRR